MKILTNLKQLSKSGAYLKSLNIEFKYLNTNVFGLCQYAPNIIISNDKEEMHCAAQINPMIKFMGNDLSPPCYNINVPENLLYETQELNNYKSILDYMSKPHTISYILPSTAPASLEESLQEMGFFHKLNYLSDTKVLGNMLNVDQISNRLPEADIYRFCSMGKVCAFRQNSKEFLLSALYLNKPCITDFTHEFCYHIDEMHEIDKIFVGNLKPIDGQVEYAEQFSITNFWNKQVLNRS